MSRLLDTLLSVSPAHWSAQGLTIIAAGLAAVLLLVAGAFASNEQAEQAAPVVQVIAPVATPTALVPPPPIVSSGVASSQPATSVASAVSSLTPAPSPIAIATPAGTMTTQAAVAPTSTQPPGATAAAPSVTPQSAPPAATGPSGITNIAAMLDTCPTTDPVYAKIRSDFVFRREGAAVGAIACTGSVSSLPIAAYTDELIMAQSLRVAYYMDLGRRGHLPWTSATLYDWLKSRIGGINLREGHGTYCCDTIDGREYIIIEVQDANNRELDRTFPGIAGNIALYAHEARHTQGFDHKSGCGIPGGCDDAYQEANLAPYAIQWWLNRAWLRGDIYVGFACLPPAQVREIALWLLAAADGLSNRFVTTKPPALVMPAQPGGACQS